MTYIPSSYRLLFLRDHERVDSDGPGLKPIPGNEGEVYQYLFLMGLLARRLLACNAGPWYCEVGRQIIEC